MLFIRQLRGIFKQCSPFFFITLPIQCLTNASLVEFRLKIQLLISGLFLCSTLTGCSVMNEQECLTADWAGIGFVDGSEGEPSTKFADRSSACSEYSIKANFSEYQKGYQKGLLTYCTESHGYYIGSNGKKYQGVCPASASSSFLKGYHRGFQLYSLRKKVENAENELRAAQYTLEDRAKKIEKLKNSLIYDDLTPKQRSKKLDKIEELEALPNEINAKRHQLKRFERELKEYLIRQPEQH